ILKMDNALANKPAWLNFVRIHIENKESIKVCITTQTVDKRLKQEDYEFQTNKVVDGTFL
ncbi:hypothetical protein NPM20_25015, partial [Vibrio parahaemolyticus]|nr:hypothetical protein [Vibrio parahaemolyticus]